MACGPPGCSYVNTGLNPLILQSEVIGQPPFRPTSAESMHPSVREKLKLQDPAEYQRLFFPQQFVTTNNVFDAITEDAKTRNAEDDLARARQQHLSYTETRNRHAYKGHMDSAYTKSILPTGVGAGVPTREGQGCFPNDRAEDLGYRVLRNQKKKNPVDYFVAIRPGECNFKTMNQTMKMLGTEKGDAEWYGTTETALSLEVREPPPPDKGDAEGYGTTETALPLEVREGTPPHPQARKGRRPVARHDRDAAVLELRDNPRRYCYPGPPGCGPMCQRPPPSAPPAREAEAAEEEVPPPARVPVDDCCIRVDESWGRPQCTYPSTQPRQPQWCTGPYPHHQPYHPKHA